MRRKYRKVSQNKRKRIKFREKLYIKKKRYLSQKKNIIKIKSNYNELKKLKQKDINDSSSTSEINLKENETSILDSEVKIGKKRRDLFITFKDYSRKIELMKERKQKLKEDYINSQKCYNIADSFDLENMYIVNSFTNEFSFSLKNIK